MLAHVYVGARLIPGAELPLFGALLAVAGLVVLCGLLVFSFDRHAGPASRARSALRWAGLLAMGYFSSLLVLTVLRDVALLLAWVAHGLGAVADMEPIRRYSAWIVPALALAASLYGFYQARRRAPVVTVEVPIAGLPDELNGFIIAQISDIHVGPTIKRRYVQAIVDTVNGLQADVVAVTGDVVDGSVDNLKTHTAPLAQLRARRGVYLVTGNHEYYSGASAWVRAFRDMGLHVLMNEHVAFAHRGRTVVVAGVTDYGAGAFDPAQASDPAGAMTGAPRSCDFRMLLAHQPRSAVAAAHVGYHLQLSGHTHGGQFLPWRFFVRFQQPYTSGLHRHQNMWVYTSRGTGYWGPPKRLGAPSEITRLILRPA